MALNLIIALLISSANLSWEIYPSFDLVLGEKEVGDSLYLATTGGVVLWSFGEDTVVSSWTTTEGIPTIPVYDIEETESDSGPVIWGADPGYGLIFKSLYDDKFIPYPQEVLHFDAARNTYCLIALGDSLFLGSLNGLFLLDTRGTYEPDDDKVTYISGNYGAIVNDLFINRDFLYVATGDGLFVTNLDGFNTWHRLDIGIPSSNVTRVGVGTNFIAIGTDNGLSILSGNILDTLVTGVDVKYLHFSGDTLYVATVEKGANRRGCVYVLYPGSDTLVIMDRRLEMQNAWTYNAFWVYKDHLGRLWGSFGWRIGSMVACGGTAFYDRELNMWRPFRLGILPFNRVDVVRLSPDSTLWVASYVYEPFPIPFLGIKPTGEFILPRGFIPQDTTAEQVVRNVTSFAFTKSGDFWIGTFWRGAIHHFGREGVYDRTIYAGSDLVKDLIIDSQGRLVVGLIDWGIRRCNPNDSIINWENLYFSSGNFDPFELKEAPDGSIWVATGTGILIIEKDGNISWITQQDGLPDPPVRSIFFDGDDAWVACANGIAHLRNRSVEEVLLQGNSFLSVVKSGGYLWALTTDGIALLDNNGNVSWYKTTGSPLTSGITISNTSHYHPMALDYGGDIWIGTDFGLNKVSQQFGTVGVDTVFLYPNPVNLNETDHIKILNIQSKPSIHIFTLTGEKIPESHYRVEYLENMKVVTLSFLEIDKFAPGLYLVLIEEGNQSKVVKLAILR